MPLFGKSNKYTLVKIKKKDIPEGLWTKCADCNTPTYTKVLKDNFSVCPKCQAHFNITAAERVKLLIDEGTFTEMDAEIISVDPLDFKGPKTYKEKLKADQETTGLSDAVITGHGTMNGKKVVIQGELTIRHGVEIPIRRIVMVQSLQLDED